MRDIRLIINQIEKHMAEVNGSSYKTTLGTATTGFLMNMADDTLSSAGKITP